MNDDLVIEIGKPHPQPCGDCGGRLLLKTGPFGPYYGCENYPRCHGSARAQGDGRPSGNPAHEDLRQKRIYAHAIFDHLWEAGYMGRNQAIAWAEKITGEKHIGKMTEQQLHTLVWAVNRYRKTHVAQYKGEQHVETV
jgi:ssDNA-binding Zn-finger/Zn-ribbon topoisomerase 1